MEQIIDRFIKIPVLLLMKGWRPFGRRFFRMNIMKSWPFCWLERLSIDSWKGLKSGTVLCEKIIQRSCKNEVLIKLTGQQLVTKNMLTWTILVDEIGQTFRDQCLGGTMLYRTSTVSTVCRIGFVTQSYFVLFSPHWIWRYCIKCNRAFVAQKVIVSRLD